MLSLLPILVLAGSSAAQRTTSFPFNINDFGTDKIGFYGSVISLVNGHTAIAVQADNGTDPNAVGRFSTQTFTLGPTYFEVAQDLSSPGSARERPGAPSNRTNPDGTIDDDTIVRSFCEWPASPPDAVASCMVSWGPTVALGACNSVRRLSTYFTTLTHTYSGRLSYSAGVETITRSLVIGPNTHGFPDFCRDSRLIASESGWSYSLSLARASIATYQIIITAGQEKLSATQGASASISGTTPTGAAAGSGSTGAAMPMKTAGPVVVGLGAAAAIFL
jgi:hypothetical protein